MIEGDVTIIVQADTSFNIAAIIAARDEAVAAAAAALASETSAGADATATAADRVQTGLDATATAADRVQTGLDRVAASDSAAAAAASAASIDPSTLLTKADNLASVASAATARTNLDVPPNARTISAGTGLSGGGSLATDRTISASIASQAQAEAGTSSTVLMTPQRAEQHMLANALGWGQTWQAVTRVAGTSYQNTTGRPIIAVGRMSLGAGNNMQVSVDNSTWVTPFTSGGVEAITFVLVVPPGHYYRSQGTTTWSVELR